MRYKHVLAAILVAAITLIAGCSGGGDASDPGSPATSGAEFNRADITFATDMIPHHRQAVEMAELAPSRAADAQVKQLAAAIAAAQDPEVRTMSGWLEDWGRPVPDEMSGHEDASMPGMMDSDDMEDLAGLRGTDFDREFLTMMKAHHEGAIEMARVEQDDGTYPAATSLATRIESDQTDEISTIEGLLRQL